MELVDKDRERKDKRNAYLRTEKGQAKRKAQWKKYYEANKEKLLARLRNVPTEVKEKRNASKRTEEARAKQRAYYEANKERLKAAMVKHRDRRIKILTIIMLGV
jgi:transcriptional regulator with AAA-type ATPase domain